MEVAYSNEVVDTQVTTDFNEPESKMIMVPNTMMKVESNFTETVAMPFVEEKVIVESLNLQKIDSEPTTPTSSPLSSPLSLSEEQERKQFMTDLHKFMAEIGKPLSKIPIMGYKELDLFQLFREVVSYGGFNEVVKNVGTWSKIWKRLGNFDPSITDSSFRLKKNYERYLLEYEFKCFPDNRRASSDIDKQGGMKRSSSHNSLNMSANDIEARSKLKIKKVKPRRTISFPSLQSLESMSTVPQNTPLNASEIPREDDGSPRFPIILNNGELMIEAFGIIINRYPYVTEKYTWPIGFKSVRIFQSMENPEEKVRYTCQIIDGGDRPQFVVSAADEVEPIISSSPSHAWRAVLKRISQKTGIPLSTDRSIAISGAMRFGLAHPAVATLLKELPVMSVDLNQIRDNNHESDSSLNEDYVPSGRSRRSVKKRKVNYNMDSSSDEDYEDEVDYYPSSSRKGAKSYPANDSSEEDSSSADNVYLNMSRDEIDDLENAVATLSTLKYCNAY